MYPSICLCIWAYICHICMYVREELAGVSSLHVSTRDQTQAVSLGSKRLYLLGHLFSSFLPSPSWMYVYVYIHLWRPEEVSGALIYHLPPYSLETVSHCTWR